MKLLLFIASYIVLDIVGSLLYVGSLLLLAMTLGKILNKDENKWTTLFNRWKGKGLYYLMIFPYVFMLLIIFGLSMFWFNWVNIEHHVLSSLVVVIILTLRVLFKLPKLKEKLNHKYSY